MYVAPKSLIAAIPQCMTTWENNTSQPKFFKGCENVTYTSDGLPSKQLRT